MSVEVRGVEGHLKDNVLAILSIAHPDERRGGTEAYLRHLHARAEEEIRRALEPYGYYRPVVRSELIVNGGWIARYEIEPGPPVLLDSVVVEVVGEGSSDPGFQELIRTFPLRPGDALVQPRYEEAKARFEARAAQGGFLDARFRPSRIHVDVERYRASILLRYESGLRHHFGEVRFEQEQEAIGPGVLAHFPTFRRGEVFDYRKLLDLQKDLSETGWFSRVEVDRGTGGPDQREVPIVVRLGPSRQLRFTAGAGYGTDDGARGRTMLELRRMNRQGHRGRVELQVAQIDKSVAVQYLVPWPFPRSDLVTWTAGYQDLRTQVSKSGAFQAGVSVRRLLGTWEAAVGLHYRRETFTVGPDVGTVDFLIPEGTWSRVRSPDRVETRGGDRVRLSVRGAHNGLLSDATFLQPRAEGKLIYGLGGRNRIVGRLEAGYTSTTEFRRLPPSVRFFAGGANSVRGYSYQSLGPRDPLGRVIGGEHLLTGSIEFDHMFLEHWGGAVFYDAGNAVNTIHDRLVRGVGVGLRWVSPLGWVRADMGWGLDRPGRPVEFHLSVGPEL